MPRCGVRTAQRAVPTRSRAHHLATAAVALQFGFGRMIVSDTIAAISTPPGEGAIALVRISGGNAIQSAEKQLIDQVVLSVHRAPASYTGDDLVEISCHGGTLVSAKVLKATLRAGARAARPGEFTERAFLNGKMDLTQAEAVIDLIRAQTDLALRSATEQLESRLGEQIRKIRYELVELLAHINASIDFPEEGIAPDEGEALCVRLDSIRNEIAALLATADQGRVLREGACGHLWRHKRRQIEFAQSLAWVRSRDRQRHARYDARYDRGNCES